MLVRSTLCLPNNGSTYSSRQSTFVWRRGRNVYVRVLFVGARYTALACALLYWFPVRLLSWLGPSVSAKQGSLSIQKSNRVQVGNVVTWLDIVVVMCSERECLISLFQDFAQSTCSHLCVEDVGNMGQELANPCISHWINYCTVAVLHTTYFLLTRVVEGFCSVSGCCDPAFQFKIHGPWHVISLHPYNERD